MNEANFIWHIDWYNKTGSESLVGEIVIKDLTSEQAREIADLPVLNEIVDGVILDEYSALKVLKYTNINFDFEKYDYFLSCSAPPQGA